MTLVQSNSYRRPLPIGNAAMLITNRNTRGIKTHTSKRLSGFTLSKLSDFDTRKSGLFNAVR